MGSGPVPYARLDMPEPDERLAPAPPEVTPPPPEVDELPTGWRAVVPDLRPLRHADYRRLILRGPGPGLVARDGLTAAGAIDALVRTVGMIGGPAFAGLLLAGPGLEAAYAIDAVPFAVSLVALTRMRAVPPPAEAERPSLRRVVAGLRYARRRPELIGTSLIGLAAR